MRKEQIKYLYKKGLSMQQISDKTGLSYHSVRHWMATHNIPRRLGSLAIYIRHNPHGDPFKFKGIHTNHDALLFGLGVGLYWGEGTKKNKTSVRLGNSDPHLLKVFMRFLYRIYGVPKSKLRFGLQIFSDIKGKEALEFWTKQLHVKLSQFQKVVITPARGIGTYKNKMKYGVLTVYFHNVKLKRILIEEIEKLKK